MTAEVGIDEFEIIEIGRPDAPTEESVSSRC
jgi:hypothetical protein